MFDEEVVKCQFCGELYIFYSFYAGNQSCCPSCRIKAYNNMHNNIRVRPNTATPVTYSPSTVIYNSRSTWLCPSDLENLKIT